MPQKPGPLALIIIDGWGYSPSREGNAIALAAKPFYDELSEKYPHTLLAAPLRRLRALTTSRRCNKRLTRSVAGELRRSSVATIRWIAISAGKEFSVLTICWLTASVRRQRMRSRRSGILTNAA